MNDMSEGAMRNEYIDAIDEREAVIAALLDALRPFDRAHRYSEELNSANTGKEHCRPHDMVCSFEFKAASSAIAKADARKRGYMDAIRNSAPE